MSTDDLNNTSQTNWDNLESKSDEEIDYSDIPPLTQDFFTKAILEISANKVKSFDPIIRTTAQDLKKLCRLWLISEFSVFGSVLNDRFNADSDIDCLVEFSQEAQWGLFEVVELKRQLSDLFNREVDLVEKNSISNPFILKSIEENHQVLYSSHG